MKANVAYAFVALGSMGADGALVFITEELFVNVPGCFRKQCTLAGLVLQK